MNKARLSISLIVSILFSSFGFAQDSSLNLQSYAANFKMAENQYCKKIFIIEKEGKLFAQSDASPGESWELKSKSTDAYSATIQNYPAELVFIRDGGKIKAIKLSVADGQVVLTGEKE